MYKDLIKISTLGMSREDWLAERRKSLGGSDVSAVLGMNEYTSPYALYADKKGLIPDKEDNEAMRIGRDLEDYVAQRFTEATGKKVRRENAIIRNPRMPYLHANVDRVVVGENAVLECKTVSALNLKQYKGGEYPDRFYAQCCEYLLVCGFDKAYLAVLVLGKGFYIYEIKRDEAELEALRSACESFWHYVETGTPPPVDGAQSTTDTISTLYPDSNDETADISAYESALEQYQAIGKRIKELKEEQDACANKVKSFLGDTGRGECSKFKVSWTSSERRTFDAKKFEAEHSEMDLDKYYKTSQVRTFRVTAKVSK